MYRYIQGEVVRPTLTNINTEISGGKGKVLNVMHGDRQK